jgi:hypothetical protein
MGKKKDAQGLVYIIKVVILFSLFRSWKLVFISFVIFTR